jgi:hypothetical protein
MELFIYDKTLNLIGITESFTSLRWIRRYYKSGEFELHCNLTEESLLLLARENIIYKTDDSEAGVIEYRNLKEDSEGKEILVVKGKFLTGYLSRRIIWGTEVLNITSENAMRTLVNKNCISPTNNNRIIPNLLLNNLKGYVGNVDYQVSYKNLDDELESLSNVSDLGHRIIFDRANKKIRFDVYKGLDRSINQSVNPRAVFSKGFENIVEQEYVDSLSNYRNVNLVAGVGEGISRKFATVGNSSGLDRFEMYTDARDLSNVKTVNDVEVTIEDAEYIPLLINRGNEKISECTDLKTFDSKVNSNSNLEYKIDFDLGDIVTYVSKSWGLTISPRITEIEEVYEEKGREVFVVFGKNIPTLIDKVKQISK